MGVLPEYRKLGVDVGLVYRTMQAGFARGVISGECSWILADNDPDEPHPGELRWRALQDLPRLRAAGMMDPLAETPAAGTVALTGATGFLGSHIADLLLARGYAVRASVRPTSDLAWVQGKGLDLRTIDLGSAADCAGFVRGVQAVIHCAGLVSADSNQAYRKANVASTEALLEACREEWPAGQITAGDKTFILISSLAAHGPSGPDRPAREDDPCRPITGYGRSKAAAEDLIRRGWPFRCAVLRPPALYGPRDRGFLPLLKAARRGWTARFGGPLAGLSLVHGRDAAGAALALLETPGAEGVFFVDDGHGGYTWAELAEALGSALDRRVRSVTIPLWLLKTVAAVVRPFSGGGGSVFKRDRIRDLEAPGWVCDGTRLRDTTGFAPEHELAAGLADTLVFYWEQKWL